MISCSHANWLSCDRSNHVCTLRDTPWCPSQKSPQFLYRYINGWAHDTNLPCTDLFTFHLNLDWEFVNKWFNNTSKLAFYLMALCLHKIDHYYYIYHLFVKARYKAKTPQLHQCGWINGRWWAKGPHLSIWLNCSSKLLIAMDQIEFSVQETESHKTTSSTIDFS